jgi:hypothetical protein
MKIKRTVRRAPVQAPPSRIRREPVAAVVHKKANAYPTEREIWIVVIGVILFALAIAGITFGVSDVTGK